ncbi:hypothetical protein [uncultured Sulfitobacter sp.]|uniref:hypothetical protein n=1 Tax=uncultured Sulfitobacter sp. TaxID=191468 RepID=UPI0030FB801E
MTEYQRELWETYGPRFVDLMGRHPLNEQVILKDLFGDEWAEVGDRVRRQNLGRAVVAAFADPIIQGQMTEIEQTVVNGTPNRMQYRRIR